MWASRNIEISSGLDEQKPFFRSLVSAKDISWFRRLLLTLSLSTAHVLVLSETMRVFSNKLVPNGGKKTLPYLIDSYTNLHLATARINACIGYAISKSLVKNHTLYMDHHRISRLGCWMVHQFDHQAYRWWTNRLTWPNHCKAANSLCLWQVDAHSESEPSSLEPYC